MQWSGMRGMFRIVHAGKVFCTLGKNMAEHSKQEVDRGMKIRDCPLNPSVPPSINGITGKIEEKRCGKDGIGIQ